MKNKINIYYDAQEYYDQMMIEAKIEGQKQAENEKSTPEKSGSALSEESTLILIETLYPHADARAVLKSIITKIDTITAIGRQYKTDIEQGGSRYKDVLLMAMSEIVIELKPYEILVRYMYPHLFPLFNSLQKWYMDYRSGVDQGDSILGKA